MLFYQLSIFTSVLHHLKERSLFLKQFKRSPCFHDPPIVHHDNIVVICHSVEPMRDRYHRGLFEFFSDNLLNKSISFHVYVRGCLVEYQKLITA